MLTSTVEHNSRHIDPLAVATRDSIAPTHSDRHEESQPVPYAELADRVATHGPAALRSRLRPLIRDARSNGVTPLLVTVLVDPAQADVARQRAFGRILAELQRRHETRRRRAHTANDAA
jgi:hypothetical protein